MSDAGTNRSIAYVRTEAAPTMPPPPGTVGAGAWLRDSLFSSIGNTILTLIIGALLAVVFWVMLDWAILSAVWTGTDRTNCAVEGAGACWPFVWAKFPQWIYGFYPIDQRWRPNIVFLVGIAALIPMMMPAAPYKFWNALFLIVAYPIISLVLLSGGNFDFTLATYGGIIAFGLVLAILIPMVTGGMEEGISGNWLGLLFAFIGLIPAVLWFLTQVVAAVDGLLALVSSLIGLGGLHLLTPVIDAMHALSAWVAGIPYGSVISAVAFLAAALITLAGVFRRNSKAAVGPVLIWLGVIAAMLVIAVILDIDFGLVPVETANWGGLLVTLVVSVTGIAASLPLGILLALGRRSRMPVVRLFSVIFIEIWRGVPLITVLFMSSVMLPLFLPEGTSFDKLLRALVGISLFSAAYMAEVVRGGLQAIPKGQYEGAMAVGLSYWQMMRMIVLPQALKISIPNIVSNFIGLFKDTTLVMIIGLYDFLGIITAGTQDGKWASPQTGNTGYFAAALIYWAFCFGMSRYAMYTERRLNTGHKR